LSIEEIALGNFEDGGAATMSSGLSEVLVASAEAGVANSVVSGFKFLQRGCFQSLESIKGGHGSLQG
jgi:hypothetical protein